MDNKQSNSNQSLIHTSYKLLIRSLDFILFSNIYVALGAFCLVQSSIVQLSFSNHLIAYSILVFFATLFIYNLQRIFYTPQKDISLQSIRRRWIFENQITIKIFAGIGFTGTCIAFFYTDFRIVFYLSPLLFLSIAYFIPSIKLRKNAWFKLLTLTSVWTLTTTVVPILLIGANPLAENNLLHILVRFCFMLAICIPFDVRDIKVDNADTISTLPHIIGENKTRWLAIFFMIVYSILIVVEFEWLMFSKKIFLALLFSAIINGILVMMTSSKRNEYFYVAIIDGTMILQGILLLIAMYI